MFAKLNRKSRCCDPFGCHKTTITKGIRNVTDKAKFHFPHLTDDDKLCTKCRKQVAALPMTRQARSRQVETSESDSDCGRNDGDVSELVILPDTFVSPDLSLLNSTLSAMGESPVVKKKAVRSHQYVAEKAKKIEVAVKRQLDLSTGSRLMECEGKMTTTGSDESEMIQQLKDKFKSCTKNSEKVHVLTVLPRSWTQKRIREEFNASDYMVRTVKKLVSEKGILSNPNQKGGKTLSTDTVDEVKAFYRSDDISRVMPGKKDFVSVNVNGGRVHAQKRLVLCNNH